LKIATPCVLNAMLHAHNRWRGMVIVFNPTLLVSAELAK